jgi:hypothetical protein
MVNAWQNRFEIVKWAIALLLMLALQTSKIFVSHALLSVLKSAAPFTEILKQIVKMDV